MNDNMETLSFEISDVDFLTLAKMAHEQNITFNQLVVNVLEKQLADKTEGT
jgi:predicted DNA-binding ribbon-helix-helix protein